MIFRKSDARTAGLPYSTPEGLTRKSTYSSTSPIPKLVPRWTDISPRDTAGGSLSAGYIALIVILILVLIANLAALAFFLHRRHKKRSAVRSPFQSTYAQEKRQRQSWQQYRNEWFGRKPTGEDTQQLMGGYQSRMPSITISRPISNRAIEPTPIFSTNQRESLHSVGIMELPDTSQNSPEAVYDPYTRSRSRSRSNSLADSPYSSPRSRSGSPNTHASRSRNSSISSNHSRSNSNTRQARPSAQNSWSYARTRSSSNGPSQRGTSYNPSTLPETAEEYDLLAPTPSSSSSTPSASPSSTTKSFREKSLPPPPPITSPQPNKNSLSYIPSDPNDWQSDPYSEFMRNKPQFDFADYEVLQETTQVIDIAIAEPLDIPQGPLTPFGERAAKAGAALGQKSTWYKSPQNVERGNWLV